MRVFLGEVVLLSASEEGVDTAQPPVQTNPLSIRIFINSRPLGQVESKRCHLCIKAGEDRSTSFYILRYSTDLYS